MANKNGGPTCPKTDRLEELIDFMTDEKMSLEGVTDIEERDRRLGFNETAQEVIEALDWLHTMLSNRKTYQKRQQHERKLVYETAKKVLSPEEFNQIRRLAEERMSKESEG